LPKVLNYILGPRSRYCYYYGSCY